MSLILNKVLARLSLIILEMILITSIILGRISDGHQRQRQQPEFHSAEIKTKDISLEVRNFSIKMYSRTKVVIK